ncbi:hypothetical protein [Sinorhizobium meliloti]|uniref:hypothetical protein n=1 Tax=Rhizobium meliloti TaxID=382 RepID=UPI000FE0C173|nr:hypothetical protein [Sinorhizobium meliloti]RVG68165.1 hypothetical protein CN222_08810 [Sinorhizobium meliloti]
MDWRTTIPSFKLSTIPEEEHEIATHLSFLLYKLHTYAEDFLSGLLLFDNVGTLAERAGPEYERIVSKWLFIAARDGAMTIFHYGKVLHLIRSSMGKCPAFRSRVDVDALRQCARDFDAAFPLYIQIRNAIAHAGEMLQLEKQKQHSISGAIDIPGFIKGFLNEATLNANIVGRDFGYTFEGAYITYSVSHENYSKLLEIKNGAFEAFSSAAEKW